MNQKKCGKILVVGSGLMILFSVGIIPIIFASLSIQRIKTDTCNVTQCEIIKQQCKANGKIFYDCYTIEYNFTLTYLDHKWFFTETSYKEKLSESQATNLCATKILNPEFNCYFEASMIQNSMTSNKSDLYAFEVFIIVFASVYLIGFVIFGIFLSISKDTTEYHDTTKQTEETNEMNTVELD